VLVLALLCILDSPKMESWRYNYICYVGFSVVLCAYFGNYVVRKNNGLSA
jgi:hypothetical protein